MTDEKNSISIAGLQATVDNWIRGVGGGYFSPLTNMAVLTEEVGEGGPVLLNISQPPGP